MPAQSLSPHHVPENIIFCLVHVALCNADMPPLIFSDSCNIDSFLLLSAHATLSILLQIHVSQAPIFFSIAFIVVLVSQPYRTTSCKTITFIILVFVSLFTYVFFRSEEHTSEL